MPPQIHLGPVEEKPINWRLVQEDDPDDELLPVTDPAIIAVLGFDPLEKD